MELIIFRADKCTLIEVDSLHQMIVENTTKAAFWLTYSRNAVMRQKSQYLVNIHHGDEFIEWFYGSPVLWEKPFVESVSIDELPTGKMLEIRRLTGTNLHFYFLDGELIEFKAMEYEKELRQWMAEVTAKYCLTPKGAGNL